MSRVVGAEIDGCEYGLVDYFEQQSIKLGQKIFFSFIPLRAVNVSVKKVSCLEKGLGYKKNIKIG